MSNICTPYYDNQYPVFSRQSGAVATNVAILHPNIFYFVLDASWSSYNSPEFWNKGNTLGTTNNNPVNKTVYSPSPTNFSEPKTAAFTGFTSNGVNTSNSSEYNVSGGFSKGWNFFCQPKATGGTAFFSALGMRDVYSGDVNTSTGGAIVGVSGGGLYWFAGPSGSSNYARYLSFNPNLIYPQVEYYRACGFTVRPVSK